MDPIEQWKRCCLDAEYYRSLNHDEILFSDRYVVEHLDHWTKELLNPTELIASAGFFPGVKAFYPANASTEKMARKSSREAFDEMEGNCNTCRHLCRIKHEKHPQGFLFGDCLSLLKRIQFHPEDPMQMTCHLPRGA